MQRILIVEDEPSVAENLTYALETEGFHPVWAATGERALSLLDEDDFALIVLDVGLPDIDGFEVCRRIRAKSRVPVMFLTARGDEIDRVVGFEIGADDYVVKPFSPREVTARVKAILRRLAGPGDNPTPLKSGPFDLDPERCRVCYFGRPLSLTRYEYRILETFIRHPGRVYTREALMEQAWDEPDASMDRTVDAHIKSLRAKLRAIRPEVEPIVTHRGLGYALRDEP